jgi:hypothetical protein
MSRGLMSRRSSSITCTLACLANANRRELTAGVGHCPLKRCPTLRTGNPMVLAVNMPAHNHNLGNRIFRSGQLGSLI